MLHGIVYNSNEFYPEALTALKKLTMFANTDAHGPINRRRASPNDNCIFQKPNCRRNQGSLT
ncbi:MAG: hypothetical protein R2757_13540 [Draconibacterium sp.]